MILNSNLNKESEFELEESESEEGEIEDEEEEDSIINSLLLPSTSNSIKPSSITILPTPLHKLNSLRLAAINSRKRKAEEDELKNKKLKQNETTNLIHSNKRVESVVVVVEEEEEKVEEELEEGEIQDTQMNSIEKVDDIIDLRNGNKVTEELEEGEEIEEEDDITFVDSNTNNRVLNRNYSIPIKPMQALELNLDTIKEEAKSIISQLLNFGVTPEYLIDYGVSEEIIGIAFQELGYNLPPHLSHLNPYSAHTSSDHNNNDNTQHIQMEPERVSPVPLTQQQILEQTKAGLEMEISKREELLARKAASILANKQAAENAVSFLDDLFSSTPSTSSTISKSDLHPSQVDSTMTLSPNSTSIPLLSPPLSSNSHTTLDSQSHQVSSETRRAVATDFEALPPSQIFPSSSNNITKSSNSTNTRISFLQPDSSMGHNRNTLIIEFSDDESDEEDEEGEEIKIISGLASTFTSTLASLPPPPPLLRISPHPSPSIPSSINNTPFFTPSSNPITPILEETISASQRLEQKELEIQKIMLRIANMEKKRSNSIAVGKSVSRGVSREGSVIPEEENHT